MPIHEFECPAGHVTQRVFKLNDKLPGWLVCGETKPKSQRCGKRAKRRQVYRVSVGGDLPTRGAF